MRGRAGLYVVLIEIVRATSITIGKLGRFRFEAGVFAYVGSARPGLDARVGRHFRRRKAKRWNIDWLTSSTACRPIAAILIPDAAFTECKLNVMVGEIIGGTTPARGFGSHDCVSGCPAHLWRAGGRVPVQELAQRLGGEVVLPKVKVR